MKIARSARWQRFALSALLLVNCAIAVAQDGDWAYTVRPGDTIWDLSHTYLKDPNDWPRVQKHNRIQNAKQLPPGTRLLIPVAWLKKKLLPVEITNVRGDAKTISPFTGETAAAVGQRLELGTRVVTEDNANVALRFADGSTLTIFGNSEVIFDTVTVHEKQGMVDTHLRLQRGRIESEVKPFTRPRSRYEITTPAAVAAVRGTEFRIAADATGKQLRNETTDGKVAVRSGGSEQEIPAGFGTLAKKGVKPLPPRPLLKAPQFEPLNQPVYSSNVRLSWEALVGAQKYRAQLATDKQFRDVLSDSVAAQNAIEFPSLSDGDYFVRVRGIDEIELEGFDAVTALQVRSELPAPVLIAPPESGTFLRDNVSLAWNALPSALGYRVQVDDQNDFSSPLLDVFTENSTLNPEPFAQAGHYFWRVAGINSNQITGAASDAGEFRVLTTPSMPSELRAVVIGSKAKINWRAAENAELYDVQVARDSAFESTIFSQRIPANEISLSDLDEGTYYVRVRSTGEAGQTSQYASDSLAVKRVTFWPILLVLSPLLFAL